MNAYTVLNLPTTSEKSEIAMEENTDNGMETDDNGDEIEDFDSETE